MNKKKLLFGVGLLISLVVLSGFGSGYYIAGKLKENFGNRRDISEYRYLPGVFEVSAGFFSSHAKIDFVSVVSPKIKITIPQIDVVASIFSVKLNIKESTLVFRKFDYLPVQISSLSVTGKVSELSDFQAGISPHILIKTITVIESPSHFTENQSRWSANNVSLTVKKFNVDQWDELNFRADNIRLDSNSEDFNFKGIHLFSQNQKTGDKNSLDSKFQFGLESGSLVEKKSTNKLKDPLKFQVNHFIFDTDLQIELQKEQSLMGLLREFKDSRKNKDGSSKNSFFVKQLKTSGEHLILDILPREIFLSVDEFKLNVDKKRENDLSLSTAKSKIKGLTIRVQTEGLSVKEFALDSSSTIDTSLLDTLSNSSQSTPMQVGQLIDLLGNMKSEGSLSLTGIGVKQDKRDVTLDDFTSHAVYSAQAGLISLKSDQKITIGLSEEQKSFFELTNPPEKVGLTVALDLSDFNIFKFRNAAIQFVEKSRGANPKEILRSLAKAALQKPEVSLKLGLDLGAFSKVLLSASVALKNDLPKSFTVKRMESYIEAYGRKGLTDLVKKMAVVDVSLSVENYLNILKMADKRFLGQASLMFQVYKKFFKIHKNTLTTSLSYSKKGTMINGGKI